jgi:hypothetical protein
MSPAFSNQKNNLVVRKRYICFVLRGLGYSTAKKKIPPSLNFRLWLEIGRVWSSGVSFSLLCCIQVRVVQNKCTAFVPPNYFFGWRRQVTLLRALMLAFSSEFRNNIERARSCQGQRKTFFLSLFLPLSAQDKPTFPCIFVPVKNCVWKWDKQRNKVLRKLNPREWLARSVFSPVI